MKPETFAQKASDIGDALQNLASDLEQLDPDHFFDLPDDAFSKICSLVSNLDTEVSILTNSAAEPDEEDEDFDDEE